jgi:WD40 repeat protein
VDRIVAGARPWRELSGIASEAVTGAARDTFALSQDTVEPAGSMAGIRELTNPSTAGHEAPTPAPGASGRTGLLRAWDRLLYVILQVAYFRFRYDIFISYRRHYKPYVTKLKQQLEHVGYRAFFDGEECPPGSALNSTLHRALTRSAALVLVGSHDVDSPYVTMEVTTFGTTGRSIIPIDIDGALAGSRISVIHERDLVWINENGAAFAVGVPSPDVVAGIEANFSYLKRNLRQRIEGLLIATLVVAIAAGSVQYARRNVDAARKQEQTASAQARAAEGRASDAEDKRVKATAAAAEAETLKQEALRLGEAARRTAQEEQGQRAALLAAEPGREHDALLAGVLAVGPGVLEKRAPPTAAMYGVTEAVAAAARSLPVAAGWTHDARITDDGQQIVTLGADGIRWWELDTGRLIRYVRSSTNPADAFFCGESGLIAMTASPPNAKQKAFGFWDVASGRLWTTIRPAGLRGVTACSRDRKWAVVRQDHLEHLWDLHAREDRGAFPDDFGAEPTPTFSADGTRLIAGSGIVEIPSRRLIARLENPVRAGARTNVMASADFHILTFFNADRFIAGASPLGNVVVFTAEDGSIVHSFEVMKPRYGVHYLGTVERVHNTIDDMTVSPDGKHIAIADIENRITVWTTSVGSKEPAAVLNVLAMEDAPQRLKISSDGLGQADFGSVTDLRFYDEKTLLFITEAGRAYVQDFDGKRLAKRLALQDPQFATGLSAQKSRLKPAFTFDRRGRELVTFGCFAGARRWSWSDEGFSSGMRGHARLVVREEATPFTAGKIAFTADNQRLVTESKSGRRSVWDRQSGDRVRNTLLHQRTALAVTDPPDLKYHEATPGLTSLPPGKLDDGILSPGGRFFAKCCPSEVWDVTDRRKVLAFATAMRGVLFAPDDKDVLTAAEGTFSMYSLDPAWYLARACRMVRESDRQQTAAYCTASRQR